MKSDWEAVYFDGRSARRRPATVRPMTDGLHIALDDGTTFRWSYGEVRQIQGGYRGQQVRLERGVIPEALVIPDSEFLIALSQAAPGVRRRFRPPARLSKWLTQIVLAGMAAILVGGALYLWGIPELANRVAARVPVRWEAQLGRDVMEEVTRHAGRCADPNLAKALEEITATLTGASTPSPYTFRVNVVDAPVINALAAPGGYIMVYRGLLEETHAPEEFAGVLAHEIQHVLHRDATRALVREMSVKTLLNVATGGGGGMVPLQGASILATLRYSRQAEAAADRDGMRMIEAAHLDPQGMIRIYQTLRREAVGAPTYLSTHPDINDRIVALEKLAREAAYTPVPLLPGARWDAIARGCV